MSLGSETIRGVGERLDALVVGCEALTQTLEAEAQALGRMDLPQLSQLAVDREDALEAVIAADALLRQALDGVGRAMNLPADSVLKEMPLSEAVREKREALVAQRERLQRAAARVRVRASHGLAFFRSALGTSDGYGALGESRELGPGPIKFYRVA